MAGTSSACPQAWLAMLRAHPPRMKPKANWVRANPGMPVSHLGSPGNRLEKAVQRVAGCRRNQSSTHRWTIPAPLFVDDSGLLHNMISGAANLAATYHAYIARAEVPPVIPCHNTKEPLHSFEPQPVSSSDGVPSQTSATRLPSSRVIMGCERPCRG